jgi:hypothetical protein
MIGLRQSNRRCRILQILFFAANSGYPQRLDQWQTAAQKGLTCVQTLHLRLTSFLKAAIMLADVCPL